MFAVLLDDRIMAAASDESSSCRRRMAVELRETTGQSAVLLLAKTVVIHIAFEVVLRVATVLKVTIRAPCRSPRGVSHQFQVLLRKGVAEILEGTAAVVSVAAAQAQ